MAESKSSRSWIISARVNPRTFAEVLRALFELGATPKNRGEVIGIGFETLHRLLLTNKALTRFETDNDAHAFLVEHGLAPDQGQRGSASWFKRLEREDSILDAGTLRDVVSDATRSDLPVPIAAENNEQSTDLDEIARAAKEFSRRMLSGGTIVEEPPGEGG